MVNVEYSTPRKWILKNIFQVMNRISKKLSEWICTITLVSLLATSCSFFNDPLPPEEGVLLTGEPDSPAADHLLDISPVGVDQTQIENGIILTRLDVGIAPDATVAQINDALAQVNAGIVSMSSDHPFMTVAVPRQANFEAIQELANTLSNAPGIRFAFPGREMVVDDFDFPATEHWNEIHHLVPPRFPAAWNLGQHLEEACDPVPVVIVDKFSSTPPANFTDNVPGFPAVAGNDHTFHGYYVTSVLAAKYDNQPPIGANPFIECLDLRPIDISDLSVIQTAETVANQLPSEKFILNGSFGFDSTCDNGSTITPCAPETINEDVNSPLVRAKATLTWKVLTSGRWNDFLVVASAGNDHNKESAAIYDGLGEAPYRSILTISTLDDPLFHFVNDTDLWNANRDYAENGFLPLVPDPEEAQNLEQAIRDSSMDIVPPAPNVLIVGSTTSIRGQPDVDSSILIESDFSNRNPDVFAVGKGVMPICDYTDSDCFEQGVDGTSVAAPQVAGLAAYLWLLSPELRAMPASATREAILANTRTLPSGVKLIDAYAAALALDGTSGLSPNSTPNRFVLLDVNNDTLVNETDIQEFLSAFFEDNGDQKEPNQPDFSRHDLNGDGFTGGSRLDRFDLDRTGSIQFGASNYSDVVVTVSIEDQEVLSYNENAVTDLDILCYYMYSDLYSGDPDERTELLRAPCIENSILPDLITLRPGQTQQFSAFLPGFEPISWTADCGPITNDGLYTACDRTEIFTVVASRGNNFVEAHVIIEEPDGPTPDPDCQQRSICPTPETPPEPTQPPEQEVYNSVANVFPPNQELQEATMTITFTADDGSTQIHAAGFPYPEPYHLQEITIAKGIRYQVAIEYEMTQGGYRMLWTIGSIPVRPGPCTLGEPDDIARIENRGNIVWNPGTTAPLSGQFAFTLICTR